MNQDRTSAELQQQLAQLKTDVAAIKAERAAEEERQKLLAKYQQRAVKPFIQVDAFCEPGEEPEIFHGPTKELMRGSSVRVLIPEHDAYLLEARYQPVVKALRDIANIIERGDFGWIQEELPEPPF